MTRAGEHLGSELLQGRVREFIPHGSGFDTVGSLLGKASSNSIGRKYRQRIELIAPNNEVVNAHNVDRRIAP